MDYIDEIRQLAEEGIRYSSNDSRWNGNRQELKPATMKQVREFENEMHIKLPEQFVRYLTEISNGGPGADRIYSLDELRKHNPYLKETAEIEPMIGAGLSPETWKKFVETYEETEDETMLDQMIAGGLFIATPGCTMNWLLMCRGPAAGQVVLIDFDYMPWYDHDPASGYTFAEWMIDGMNCNNERAKNGVRIQLVTRHNERGLVPGVTNLTDHLIDLRIKQLRDEGAKEDFDLVPALREFYERNFANKTFVVWIAVHEKRIIGTCGLSFVEKPPYFSCTTGRIALLSSVYVKPEFRRRGIAKRLVGMVTRYAKRKECGAIHITASNEGAKLYTAMGFEHNGNFMQMKL